MIGAILALGIVAAPAPAVSELVETTTDPDTIGRVLLDAAHTAQAQGHAAARERFLRGWASLGAHPTAPDDLSSAAAEAIHWSATAGSWRMFATRLGDRVRIGLADPAALGVRIEVTGRSHDRAMTLQRAESESPGRIEHVVDPALGPDARVEIRAWCDALDPPLLLRRVVLDAAAAGPEAPDPASVRGAPERLRRAPPPVVAAADPPWPWWWFAVGAVAVGLAGAAVWQETQP